MTSANCHFGLTLKFQAVTLALFSDLITDIESVLKFFNYWIQNKGKKWIEIWINHKWWEIHHFKWQKTLNYCNESRSAYGHYFILMLNSSYKCSLSHWTWIFHNSKGTRMNHSQITCFSFWASVLFWDYYINKYTLSWNFIIECIDLWLLFQMGNRNTHSYISDLKEDTYADYY